MKVQVIIESDNGNTEVAQDIVALDRGPLRPEELGLKLAEVKSLLQGVQLGDEVCFLDVVWADGRLVG